MFLLLHGPDEFSSRELLYRLINDPRFSYNVERYDGATADLNAVRIACETMPFLAEARLVVVEGLPKPRRGADAEAPADPVPEPAGPGKGKRGMKKPTAAALAREFAGGLAELAGQVPPTTTLALWVGEELPKTSPLLPAAVAHGKIHLSMPRTGAALEHWMAVRAKHEGVGIAPDAVRLLADLTAGNLRILASEIAKLATYVGPNAAIDVAAVRALVPDNREARVFDLTDALGRGDRATALRLLHELLDAGEAPLGILAMITRQVRLMAQVHDLTTRQRSATEIAQVTGLAPFLVQKSLGQVRQFTAPQIDAALRACLEVDKALKRSQMSPELALDLLITEFGRATTAGR